MTIRRLHRLNAALLGIFIALHLANHVIGLTGLHNHILLMDALRNLYRYPIVEIILLALFAIQIALGLMLIAKRGKPKENWGWIQVISGGYIAFFLLQHLSAVIMMRFTYPQLDTNFYWAASVVQAKPLGWYFLPYYALAILAVFSHAAAAIHFGWPSSKRIAAAVLTFGAVLAIAIPASLVGMFYPVNLPQEYLQYMREFYPSWLIGNN